MSRPPPGRWRLLAPAVFGWALTAWAVTVPGSGRWISIVAAVLGTGVLVVTVFATRRAKNSEQGSARWQRCWGIIAIGCAALVMLGTQIDAGEWRRSDPDLATAATQSRQFEMRVTVASYVADASSAFGDRYWVRAALHSKRGDIPVLLWLEGKPDERWVPGATLELAGRAERFDAGSAAAYGVTVQDSASAKLVPAGPLAFAEQPGRIANELRLGLRAATAQLQGAELLPGFAVGDTSLVSDELQQNMLQTSLTHLTAVSGANCALVTSVIIWCSSMLGAGRRVRLLLAAAALTGFVFVVGPDPSVQRAAVMAAVMLVSGYGGKRALALPSLGVAILILLGCDPWQALQPGFALSVVATAGILLAVPTLSAGLRRVMRVPHLFAIPIAVALAAQIACGPLLLLLQPGIPAAGLLANVIAAPAAPLGTGVGLLAMMVIPLSEPLGMMLVQLGAVSARWVAATAEICAQLPMARWAWPGGWFGAALLAMVEVLPMLAWAWHTGRMSSPGGARVTPRLPWQLALTRPLAVRSAVAVSVCAACGISLGITVVAPITEQAGTPRDWHVVACDVGQGDAILLQDPAIPGSTILVDTGKDPVLLSECLARFDVKRINLLVLSHDDQDHVGALSAVVSQSDAALISPPSVGNGDSETTPRKVVRELEAAGVPYEIGSAGMSGRLNGAASGDESLSWEVLAPRSGTLPETTNAASLVMRVRSGAVTVMLLADTGAEEHRQLLSTSADLRADVVKVSHHGSRDQDPRLLEAVGAKIGLVSVGADNGYGHPTVDALDAIRDAGSLALRTDESGSIAISGEPGSLRAWSEHPAVKKPGA